MPRSTTSSPALNSQAALVPMLGFAVFQIAAATARLGVPDAIGDGAATAEELAATTGADPAALFRLLRAAAAVGLLTMSDGKKFELTDMGGMFRTDSPVEANSLMLLNSAAPIWKAWGGLADAVRAGETAFDQAYGVGIFDHLEREPELARLFHAAMASGTRSQIPQLARHYSFPDAEHIIDIGGGNGTHIAAVLEANPRARGTVFDTASGISAAPEVLGRAGVADRCATVAGDFFASVPADGNVYLLKNILVDWDDDSCVRILRNCRTAMTPRGRVVVVTTLMPEDIGTQSASDVLPACIFDISLMVTVKGRERTLAEYERLFTRAGLSLSKITRVTPDSADHTTSLFHILEAVSAAHPRQASDGRG
ncbi:methyltransferase [Actinoallomurus liliacearum]|uniref:Methyltransferase n=1 Tax=Actinoallomurus liliacearum TaxID=1080073 RepID=A0ABP8TPY3_9ACTN